MSRTHDPTGDALYAAILAHPDEDTPRLAYADHIEEFGDAHRAEFIRLQCALAAMKEWDEGHAAADVRCRRRLAEHPEWAGAVRDFHPDLLQQAGSLADNPRGPHGVFVRGFPGRVGADAVWFAQHHAALFARFPIRTAGFRVEDADARDALAGCAGLARLTGLGVSMWNEERAGLLALARLPHATGLKKLEVYAEAIDAGALEELLHAPQFRTVEAFVLWSDSRNEEPLQPEEVARTLAPSSWLFALTDLHIDGNLFAALCERLALEPGWPPRLKRLALRGYLGEPDRTGPAVVAAIRRGLGGGWFAAVEGLDLGLCAFGGLVCNELAASGARRPARLVFPMRFRGPRADPHQPRPQLLASDWLGELRALAVQRAAEDETAALVASRLPGRLRRLDLSNGTMSGRWLGELLDVPGGWPHLESLDLSGNPLPDDALAELAGRLDRFPRLVSLVVGNYRPLSKFVRALAGSPAAAQLRELSVSGPLADADLDRLASAEPLADLDLLRVEAGDTSAQARDRLQAWFGPRVAIEDGIPF